MQLNIKPNIEHRNEHNIQLSWGAPAQSQLLFVVSLSLDQAEQYVFYIVSSWE